MYYRISLTGFFPDMFWSDKKEYADGKIGRIILCVWFVTNEQSEAIASDFYSKEQMK